MNDKTMIGRLRASRAQRTLHALPRKPEPDSVVDPRTIRVATYNIHKGVLREYFGLKRIPRIHELRMRLHEIEADLIFLQEVQGRHAHNERRYDQWPLDSQELFLARSPTLAHTFESVYGQNATYLHGHHGNALLSRFQIMRHEQRDISDHALEKRGLLHCVTRIGDRDVHCFVVHFGLFAGSRQRQLEAMIEWIDEEVPSTAPLIIAGDFNDWREKLSDSLCHSLGMVEVFDAIKAPRRVQQRMANFVHERLPGLGHRSAEREALRVARSVRAARTFPALVPWLRMDRIYQRGFDVEYVRVLRGPTWARLSDHSPLVADLRLR
ncbi:MAG: endonuclease/exonuclease/phosphatase family protein [Burkholderiaceae bacterium]